MQKTKAQVGSQRVSGLNKVSYVVQDLDDCKHSLTALEMEGMVGEEQNDLLDYLRSLEPDKVCKLSSSFLPTLYNTGYV
jgi:hypothetical protein